MESVNSETFEQDVLSSDVPVIVDFWAEWCGPCHRIAPVLEAIQAERTGEIKVVKLNIDEEHELSMRYGVLSIPTLILFVDGQPAAVTQGALPKGVIEQQLGLEPVAA